MLEKSIHLALRYVADEYSIDFKANTIQEDLEDLVVGLSSLVNNYSPKVVVLIDEYDAPIVNLPKGSDLEHENIKVMKDFFMTLKSLNIYFKLTFSPGVSKFSLSDVFSGANHLKDITIHQSADAMLGYTEVEILTTFSGYIENIKLQWSKYQEKDMTTEEVLTSMRLRYNGYRFNENGPSVYNPWSTFNFLGSVIFNVFLDGKSERISA